MCVWRICLLVELPGAYDPQLQQQQNKYTHRKNFNNSAVRLFIEFKTRKITFYQQEIISFLGDAWHPMGERNKKWQCARGKSKKKTKEKKYVALIHFSL